MVKTVIIDCARLGQREEAHRYLTEALELPDYYGNNLDGLFDCLTETDGLTLVLRGAEELRRAGGYGARILDTMADAAREDPGLLIREEGPEEDGYPPDSPEGH